MPIHRLNPLNLSCMSCCDYGTHPMHVHVHVLVVQVMVVVGTLTYQWEVHLWSL